MMIFFSLFFLLYGGLNYYVGLWAWRWLRSLAPLSIPSWVYWTTFWPLAFSFFLARLSAGRLPLAVTEGLMWVGAYWLAMLVYAVQLLVLVDLFRLLNRWTGILPTRFIPDIHLIQYTGAVVCLMLLALMVYGTWRARTPVVTEYALAIPKGAGPHRALNVVLVADTHLGYLNGKGRIRELVEVVNGLQPDLILIAGDLIDDDVRPFVAHGMAAELSRLQSRLGTYAVLGNHDNAPLAEFRAELQRAGIRLLVDEWVKVDDSIVLAGRKDHSPPRPPGPVTPLAEILRGVDRSLPILLMDHNPNRLADAVAAGVDLQVSGHTHRGQLFPFHLITSRVFAVDWGYLKLGDTHFVVTSGFGTWGPPIRIGNRPEVVRIRLTFGGSPAGHM